MHHGFMNHRYNYNRHIDLTHRNSTHRGCNDERTWGPISHCKWGGYLLAVADNFRVSYTPVQLGFLCLVQALQAVIFLYKQHGHHLAKLSPVVFICSSVYVRPSSLQAACPSLSKTFPRHTSPTPFLTGSKTEQRSKSLLLHIFIRQNMVYHLFHAKWVD